MAAGTVAAAASPLVLRVLVDDIFAQSLGAARQLDCLEVHTDGGDEDESDAAETDHEAEVRLSGHVETLASERLCGRAYA